MNTYYQQITYKEFQTAILTKAVITNKGLGDKLASEECFRLAEKMILFDRIYLLKSLEPTTSIENLLDNNLKELHTRFYSGLKYQEFINNFNF